MAAITLDHLGKSYTADVTAVGTLRLLEAIRDVQDAVGCQMRFYQASSSEIGRAHV